MTEDLADFARALDSLREDNTRLLRRLAEGEKRVRLVSRGVLRVQEAERARISRELHDGVGQALTAIKIQLELLSGQARDGAMVEAARLLEMRDLADRTLQDVRQISHLLRPQMLDELGLEATLKWLTRTFAQRTGTEVALATEGLGERLEPDLETLAYRVVQEALTNVAKHARAASASVTVRATPLRLEIRVADEGGGFDAASVLGSTDEDRGFGVRGMRDRVQLLGGRFAVRSTPGEGTRVEADVPLHEGRD